MAKPQLFLLHFAGGNCYSFQFLVPYLKEFEIIPLELPGRGRRMHEDLLRDFHQAALDLYDQIVKRQTHPRFLIYGHSMGAYLGLRVTRMLEDAGKNPCCLFVSGNPGPGVRDNKRRYLLGPDEFVEELQLLGGVPEELIRDKELFDLFEPVLRADFEIAEKNDMKDELAVRAPLFAFMGNEEDDADKISNWGQYTLSRYDFEILEGGHFFIHRHPGRIAGIIKANYDRSNAMQHH